MKVHKDAITLREFLKAVEGLPAEALDQPMRMFFPDRDRTGHVTYHTSYVLKPFIYPDNVLIGPDGMFLEQEVKKIAYEEDVEEGFAEYVASYQMYIPKYQLMLFIDNNDMQELPVYGLPAETLKL